MRSPVHKSYHKQFLFVALYLTILNYILKIKNPCCREQKENLIMDTFDQIIDYSQKFLKKYIP